MHFDPTFIKRNSEKVSELNWPCCVSYCSAPVYPAMMWFFNQLFYLSARHESHPSSEEMLGESVGPGGGGGSMFTRCNDAEYCSRRGDTLVHSECPPAQRHMSLLPVVMLLLSIRWNNSTFKNNVDDSKSKKDLYWAKKAVDTTSHRCFDYCSGFSWILWRSFMS